MNDRLSKFVWISMMSHGIVAMLIFLRAVFIPDQPIQVQNAVRVDIVALPEKQTQMPLTPPSPPQAETAPPPKAKAVPPAPPPEPDIPKMPAKKNAKSADLSKKEKEALNRLKTLEALEKIKHDVAKEKTPKAASLPIKGNQVSAGNSLTGTQKLDYDRYYQDLKAKVLSEWSIPQWLSDANYKASVQVLIDERGYVIKKMIRRSSGNEVFDTKAMEAIEASSPLPAPPETLRGVLSTIGVTFNFPE